MSLKITGKNPTGEFLEAAKRSPQYKNKGFENLSETSMMLQDSSYYEVIKKFFSKNPDAKPPGKLPSIETDLKNIHSEKPVIIWFGHSSYFIRAANKNILVDPVFSRNASPVSFMVHAFDGADVYQPEDFPVIDCLILTHDHYDHLDYKTLRKFKNKLTAIYCSLGVGSHLRYWDFDEKIIHEMDWWQTNLIDKEIKLTAAPARHFSGRGLKRFKTLWSSFILEAGDHKIYIGGDSGYDSHFKEIGERFGPFDIVILEAGQYNTAWPLIHMMPEETVQAAVDLGAKILLPVHWGKFTLAMHAWNEPVQRVSAKAKEMGLRVTTPKIGEPVILDENYPSHQWWNEL